MTNKDLNQPQELNVENLQSLLNSLKEESSSTGEYLSTLKELRKSAESKLEALKNEQKN